MDNNEHNEKETMRFTMSSRVPDLLMSPVFDAPDVHWFAAGNNDGTWLEIVKSNGRLHLHPWQMVDTAAGPVKKNMPPERFVVGASYEAMRYNNDDASLTFYQYSLHVALLAAKDACDRGDRPTAQTIVHTLRPHIPWLGNLLDRSVQLHGPENAMKKLDDAMHASGMWEMGDTKRITDGPIQPYVKTAALVALLRESLPEGLPALHALTTPTGETEGYLWTRPSDCYQQSDAITVLLSPKLQPLLVLLEDSDSQTSAVYTAPWTDYSKDCWELPYKDPLAQTLFGWKECMKGYHKHPGAWFDKMLHTTPIALKPETLAAVLRTWATDGCTRDWAGTGPTDELFQWSQWLVQTWGDQHPDLKYVLEGLMPTMEFSEDLASVEEIRLAIKELHRMQNDPTEEQAWPLPDLDATAPVVP